MAMQSADVFETIAPVEKKYWGLGRKRHKTQYDKIFNVGSTDEPVKDAVEYGGHGTAVLKNENEPVYKDRIVEGVKRRWMAATYAIGTEVSRELVDDCKYAEMKKAFASAGMSMTKTPEYLAALFLDRAFNSAYPALGDNIELCATNHTVPKGGVYSNELATPAALSEAAIEQVMTNLRTMPWTDGMIQPLFAQSLVVPSALFNTAQKLSLTKKEVGTANNTESLVAGMKVIPFDFLASATRWFVLTDYNTDDEGLFWDFRKRPEQIRENIGNTLTALYVSFFRAMWGCIDGRAIYGSAAS